VGQRRREKRERTAKRPAPKYKEQAIMSILRVQPKIATEIPEPPIAKFLFSDTRMAVVWLVARLYVAYFWITAGLEKLTGYNYDITAGAFGSGKAADRWIFNGSTDGVAFAGFLKGAVAKAGGAHPAVQGWYADFLKNVAIPNASWFAYVITFGEIAVGLGLIVGALTGIAAFSGLFMNLNFLLAGTTSINPVLGAVSIFLVLAWRIAGYYGVDRYLLPLLGTPWTGLLYAKEHVPAKLKAAA
jgi:thiosulfate dehydrogenase [quinone] large subunit